MRTKRPTETQLLVDARAIERDLHREPVAHHRRTVRTVSAAQRRRWAFQAGVVEQTAEAARNLEHQALVERERWLDAGGDGPDVDPNYNANPDQVDNVGPEWVIEGGTVVA